MNTDQEHLTNNKIQKALSNRSPVTTEAVVAEVATTVDTVVVGAAITSAAGMARSTATVGPRVSSSGSTPRLRTPRLKLVLLLHQTATPLEQAT